MTLTRRDRILALAWSLPDALNTLQSRNPETRRMSPAAWQLCLPCDGSGNTRDRFNRPATCAVCQGAGRYRTDPYANGAVISGAEDQLTTRQLTRPVKCDRCAGDGVIPGRWIGTEGLAACPTCQGTGSLHVPIFPTADSERTGKPADDNPSWIWRGGDWDALDSALEAMRCNGRRPLWRAFISAYVEPPYATTDDAQHALEHVQAMMPTKVRVPAAVKLAWADHQDGTTRDERIRRRAAQGMGTTAIATSVGCSLRTVQRVLYTRRHA